ncbi:MAG: hypothetical protein ACOZF0_07890 [Thermodesulfobacteriota bacterium]
MFQKLKEKVKAKQHIIVLTVMTVYLIALAVKTGQVFYTDYWLKRAPAAQTQTK